MIVRAARCWPVCAVLLLGASAASAHDERAQQASRIVEIPARVVADPRATIVLAAAEDGRVEPPPGGFPLPGHTVHAGQLLAILHPSFSQSERRDIGADLALIQRDEHVNKLQMDRYQVDGSRPFDVKLPTITVQLVADYRSAHAQAADLLGALHDGGVPIIAAQDGVLLRAPARAGRIAVLGEPLFELHPVGALAVVADYIDDDLDASAPASAETLSRMPLNLQPLGSGDDPLLRSHRSWYAVQASAADAAAAPQVGDPVRLRLVRRENAVLAESSP